MPETITQPQGQTTAAAAKGRAERSPEYRAARDEYARIRQQEQVAAAVGTSHTNISRMERGSFMPKLPTLQKIAAVLDEELLVCFERTVDGEVEREFAEVR